MAIKKWRPLGELEVMRDEMERMWDELFPTPRRSLLGSPWRRLSSVEGVSIPAIDVLDKPGEVVVKVEIPGVDKKDIDVSMDDGTLSIRAEVAKEKEEKDEHYVKRERSYQYFERSIGLPSDVLADKVKAELKDGVLSIRVPKADAKKVEKAKKIEVEAG